MTCCCVPSASLLIHTCKRSHARKEVVRSSIREIGQVIESSVVGEVIDSRSPDLKPGDVVSGLTRLASPQCRQSKENDENDSRGLTNHRPASVCKNRSDSLFCPSTLANRNKARLSSYLEPLVRSVCLFVRSRRSRGVARNSGVAMKRTSTCATNLGSTTINYKTADIPAA